MTHYIIMGIAALVIIVGLLIFVGRTRPAHRLSKLAAVAFAFVIGGIVFGENRIIGYSLMGIGVLLAIIDARRGARV